MALFVTIISMLLHARAEPYYTKSLNKMENYSLIVSAMTLYSGMFYITGEDEDYLDNNFIKWLFFFAIILPNLVFFVYFVQQMRIELLKEALYRSPKLFRILSCGMEIEKFREKYMEDDSAVYEDDMPSD
mmetsp:Transcript_15829/g.11483  ORF Transcript_15829/g.11483 Transcript_15829/m.11483 type:complete len:130 (+) Transcript_15829:68-457(+)